MGTLSLIKVVVISFTIVITIGFLCIFVRWLSFRRALSEIEWQIFAVKIRIQAELERFILQDVNLIPICREKLLDEIYNNKFNDWDKTYLEPDSLTCELPRSIWLVMKWLMLRQNKATSEFARKIDQGKDATLPSGNKFQLFMNSYSIPNWIYFAQKSELDYRVQQLFPKITDDLVRYRRLVMAKNICL
ncbi:MAG: hypothetical protein WC725_01785 [Patescibacteria group bacterium]